MTTITESLTVDESTIDDSAVEIEESTITASATVEQSTIIGSGTSSTGSGTSKVHPSI